VTFSLVSLTDEIAIGRQIRDRVRAKTPIIRDARISAYISRLGLRLAERAGGPAYPYTFDIADLREINAFTLPGGSIWIHRGAIEAAQNESQLAAVLAHEVAHAAHRHVANQLSMAIAARLAMNFLGAALGNIGGAVTSRAVADALANGSFRRFSQADETEADGAGVVIMHRAGWDPRGMLQFLDSLARVRRTQPGLVEQFLSTHPPPVERANHVRSLVSRLRGGAQDSASFHAIRVRLARLPRQRQHS
jgi:predicted Zn-dependent protease